MLVASQVQVAGDVSDLLASHYRLSGPRRDVDPLPANQEVIEESHTDKQSTLLIRTDDPILDPAWTVTPVNLEDVVLAYMGRSASRATRPPIDVGGGPMTRFAWLQSRTQTVVAAVGVLVVAADRRS